MTELALTPFGSADLLLLKSVSAALHEIERFILSGRERAARRIMLLTGPPSSGKTRLIEEIRERFPPEREEARTFRRTRHPIVHVDLPSPCDLRSLCCAIFREFGLRRGTVNVVAETGRFLKAIGVEALVLDEGDHLLSSREERQTVQFIIDLMRQGICQVILCGSSKLKRLLDKTPTDISAPEVIIYSLSYLGDEEVTEAVRALQQVFPCEDALCSEPIFISSILAAVEGRVGALARLWRVAAIHAAAKGRQAIALDDLSLAWRERGTSGENPFGRLAGGPAPETTILVRQNPYQEELDPRLSSFRQPRYQLPIRLYPFEDASLIGFLMRLGEANCLSRFTELVGTHPGSRAGLPLMHSLARLADLPLNELQRIAYVRGSHHRVVSFMGHALPAQALSHRRRLCPLCLAESPYHRAIWDLDPLKICPKHRVRLIAICPACRQELSFESIPLTRCHKRGLPVWPDTRQPLCQYNFAGCPSREASRTEMQEGRNVLRWLAGLPAF